MTENFGGDIEKQILTYMVLVEIFGRHFGIDLSKYIIHSADYCFKIKALPGKLTLPTTSEK